MLQPPSSTSINNCMKLLQHYKWPILGKYLASEQFIYFIVSFMCNNCFRKSIIFITSRHFHVHVICT